MIGDERPTGGGGGGGAVVAARERGRGKVSRDNQIRCEEELFL